MQYVTIFSIEYLSIVNYCDNSIIKPSSSILLLRMRRDIVIDGVTLKVDQGPMVYIHPGTGFKVDITRQTESGFYVQVHEAPGVQTGGQVIPQIQGGAKYSGIHIDVTRDEEKKPKTDTSNYSSGGSDFDPWFRAAWNNPYGDI